VSVTERPSTHAALMDEVYRHQRFIYDLTRKYYLLGRDRLIEELALRPGERVVEVGCGTARNLIRIARRYPGTALFGLDASHEMLKTAEAAVKRAGLEGRITLRHGYAESLSPAFFGQDGPFDRIVFSYALSMIPDWNQALKSAAATLAEDGSVHVVDFGDLMGLGRVGRKALLAWLALFHVEPRVEILRRLEHTGPEKGTQDNDLWIVPGRYAFLWRGRKTELLRALH